LKEIEQMKHEEYVISRGEALEVPVTDARAGLAELVDLVSQHGQRVILTKHKHPTAVLVSMPDLATLEATDADAHVALSWPASKVGDFGSTDLVLEAEDPADVTARNDLLDLKRKVEGVMEEINEMIHAHDRTVGYACAHEAAEKSQVA
jgi:prevent-host-death family protein